MATKQLQMSDLLKNTPKKLVEMRGKIRKELFEAKLKNATRTLNQPHIIKVLRRNIARINTAMTQLRMRAQTK